MNTPLFIHKIEELVNKAFFWAALHATSVAFDLNRINSLLPCLLITGVMTLGWWLAPPIHCHSLSEMHSLSSVASAGLSLVCSSSPPRKHACAGGQSTPGATWPRTRSGLQVCTP